MHRLSVAIVVLSALGGGLTLAGDDESQAGYSPIPIYSRPLRPLLPESRAECAAYDRAWQEVRQQVSKQHDACLSANTNGGCPGDPVTRCTCVSCAQLHDSSKLGAEEVADCYDTVERHLDQERERKASEEKAENERRDREQAARQRAEDDRREADRRQDARDRQRADDRRELDRAEDRSERLWDRLSQRIEMRDVDRQRYQNDQQQARAAFDRETRERASLARRLTDAIGLTSSSGEPEAANAGGDFGFSFDAATPTPTAAGLKEIFGKLEIVTAFNGFLAGVPFTLLGNVFEQNLAAMDRLGVVIENFDRARVEDVDRISRQYLDDAWSPRVILKQIVAEAIVGTAADYVVRQGINPAFESGLGRLDRAWYQREPGQWLNTRELFRDAPAARGVVYPPFWTGRPGREEWTLRTDNDGVPLLRFTGVDQNGLPVDGFYRYDSAVNRVAYTQRDVDALVANGNYTIAWQRRSDLVWHQNQLSFTPRQQENPECAFCRDAAAFLVGESLKTIYEDPNPPNNLGNLWEELRRLVGAGGSNGAR